MTLREKIARRQKDMAGESHNTAYKAIAIIIGGYVVSTLIAIAIVRIFG